MWFKKKKIKETLGAYGTLKLNNFETGNLSRYM